jgi:hypothetical protein
MPHTEVRRRDCVSAAATNTGSIVEKSVDNALPTFPPVRTRQRRPALACSTPETSEAPPTTTTDGADLQLGRARVRTRRRPALKFGCRRLPSLLAAAVTTRGPLLRPTAKRCR